MCKHFIFLHKINFWSRFGWCVIIIVFIFEQTRRESMKFMNDFLVVSIRTFSGIDSQKVGPKVLAKLITDFNTFFCSYLAY